RGLEGANRGFTTRAGALHTNVELAHAHFVGNRGGRLSSHLGRKRSALARPLEARLAGRTPGDDVATRITDGHDGVVEGGAHGAEALQVGLALSLLRLDDLGIAILGGSRFGCDFGSCGLFCHSWIPRLTVISSCSRWSCADPCGYGRSSSCAARAREDPCDDAGRGSSRCRRGA